MQNIKTIWTKTRISKPYIIINFAFAGIIILIMLYSGIFSADSEDHPIECIHYKISGEKCETCGISRGFSEIVRFRFEEALEFNRNSILLFLFFSIQFIMRIVVSVIYLKRVINHVILVVADASISIILFVITFKNLLFNFL
ncbi:MAG: DUF2752 domain-containing protein [Bacteroidota bacterium]